MKKLAILSLLCLLFIMILPAQAASPGAPDVTFGTGGFDFDALPRDATWDYLTVDASGRILTAGAGLDVTTIYVARFTPDGQLDLTFGSNGIATFNPDLDNEVRGLLIDSAGRIVVAGNTFPELMDPFGYVMFVARLLDNGTLDTSFNATGITYLQHQPEVFHDAKEIALAPGDKIVLTASIEQPAVIRLNADGILDTSFDTDGYAWVNEANWQPTEVVVSADGKVSAVGSSLTGGMWMARFNNDGSLDTTFDGDGKVLANLGHVWGHSASFDSNGKLVVAGTKYLPVSATQCGDTNGYLTRYNVDGSLDTSFGNAGEANINLSECDFFSELVIDSTGRIIVVGADGYGSQTRSNFAVARFTPNGVLDTSFGDSGVITHHFGGYEMLFTAALQGDKVVTLAYTTSMDFTNPQRILARYHNETSSGQNLLTNGSFETDADGDKVPDGWNAVNASADRRRCNTADTVVAAQAQCAYQFKNDTGENSKLHQKLTVSNLLAGDRLSLVAHIHTKKNANIKVNALITYTDGTTEKLTVRIKRATQKQYVILQKDLTLAKDVADVKVTVTNRSTTGRSLLDNVQLVHTPQSAAPQQGGFFPLPPAS